MKKLLFLLPIITLFMACSDDDQVSTNMNINLKATYDGAPLMTNTPLSYGDATIELTTSEFFVSNFVLTDENGEEQKLEHRSYINFTDTNFTMAAAEEGISFNIGELPDARYTNIRFAIGLNSDVNATLPEQFSSSDALNQGEYWPGWESYIFMKQQGRYRNPAQNIDDLAFVFHLGSDEIYREVSIDIDMIVNDDNNTISLEMDHYKLFGGDGNLFDIPSSPLNHKIDSKAAMEYLANNYQSAFE